ncbi:MAG: MT-A70 family methyltransferase [Actinomycetota bacterium]|nr:MT-A70 family methyltransferase [Actinomycetota bacterium]
MNTSLQQANLRALSELRLHPDAGLVPEMPESEYGTFCLDLGARGLQVPLDVTEADVVLDGRARLRAAKDLGWEQIEVRVIAPADEVAFMLLAAIRRRQLDASQRAAIALELEDYEQMRDRARIRQRQNLRQHAEVAMSPPHGKTREQLAKIAGTSARTAQDVITVYEHDRALFEQVKAGKVSAPQAARRVRRLRRDAGASPSPALPEGPFEIVYADPPWQLGNPDGPYAPEQHYPTLPLAAIKALALPAPEHAVLFLWAVNCLLPQALEVMEAWGFTYVTNLVWVKPSIGLGRWVRNRHELLLVGRKGDFPAPELEDLPDSVIEAARRRHSEKPACVREAIERMYPHASKVELFARGAAPPGWFFWGNEAEGSGSSEAGS